MLSHVTRYNNNKSDKERENMKRQNIIGELKDKRLLNIKEVCIYTGKGQVTARKYMDEIGSHIKFNCSGM